MVVRSFAACAPQAGQEMYTAWKDRDSKLADEKQHRIVASSQRIGGQMGIAGIKYDCDLTGYFGGFPRLP